MKTARWVTDSIDPNRYSIHGLTHIGFKKGDLESAFEQVRRVLEREGVLLQEESSGEHTAKSPSVSVEPKTPLRRANSPRAAILIPDEDLRLFIPVVEFEWDGREAKVSLEPDFERDGPCLDGLRGTRKKVYFGYRNNASVATVQQVRHSTLNNKDRWQIAFSLQEADSANFIEATEGLTADEAASRRARRILLNEDPAPNRDNRIWDSDVLRQMMITGQESVMKIKKSSLPGLFLELHDKPEVFLESAWILAALQLKLSAAVEHVVQLELTLSKNALGVVFSGRRKQRYANHPAYLINVSGTCALSD